MKLHYIFTVLVLIAGLSSCEKNSITGAGETVVETRAVADFDAVSMGGATKIHITYGNTFNVELKGYGNLIPLLKTEVRNRKLIIGFRDVYNVHRDNTEAFITMPVVKSVHVSGSGNTDIKGRFPHIPFLSLSISGSGEINMEAGSADDMEIQISGSGNVNLFSVAVKQAEVSISGSGKARVSAADTLDVLISGSGSVYYKGSPQVNAEISGSGKVVKQI